MKAVIKAADISGLGEFETYRPLESPDFFAIEVTFALGLDSDLPGSDLFRLTVISPSYLDHLTGPIDNPADHALVLEQYDPAAVVEYVERRLDAIEGESWDDIAPRIALFMEWEFDETVTWVGRLP